MKVIVKIFSLLLIITLSACSAEQTTIETTTETIIETEPGEPNLEQISQAHTYPETDYKEPYRGQFHYSSPGGWINDVNGVWYYDGFYHLSYQHYPYGLEWGPMHWGHATSTDMMNWKQEPIMLEPGVNTVGGAFSGSTVVDVNNTSGLQSGKNAVFVAVYTDTELGTSLAYSNDLGVTWEGYSGNPVNIGSNTDSDITRDPHIFWYEPDQRWIALIYDLIGGEQGTDFYSSSDLKEWKYESRIDFGYECPAIYKLPVDGDKNQEKWVLHDADGMYHIGEFNGKAFTPDEGGPYAMELGPDFYAAQNFNIASLEDDRVIEMAWLDSWNGGLNTAPWSRELTFPTEMKLKTFPEGIRVTRTPIEEINNLYTSSTHWNDQVLKANQNFLSGINSKAFNFELQIDLEETTATQVIFQITDQKIVYDITENILAGKPFTPLDNKVKIRMLVDWGQLELFGNDGQFSYTHNMGFVPNKSTVAMYADGDVKIASANFNNLGNTWGKTNELPIFINDSHDRTSYSSAWTPYNNDSVYYGYDAHVGGEGEQIEFTFEGTEVSWHGLKNNDLGIAKVYIDNELVDEVDCYDSNKLGSQLLYSKKDLPNEEHTIKIEATGNKNKESSGESIVHDYFSYIPGEAISDDFPAEEMTFGKSINNSDEDLVYTGTWETDEDPIYYGSSCSFSKKGSVQYIFEGDGISLYGLKNVDLGIANIYIDDVLVDEIDCYSPKREAYKIFEKTELGEGSHTIRVETTNTKNPDSSETYFVFDRFEVLKLASFDLSVK